MRVMPTSFLIDSRGVVRARQRGFRDEDEPAIEAEVRACLRAVDLLPASRSTSSHSRGPSGPTCCGPRAALARHRRTPL